jgi:hypothetical protein
VSEKPGDSVTVDVKKDNIGHSLYEITHLKGTELVTVTGPAVKYMEEHGGNREDISGERIEDLRGHTGRRSIFHGFKGPEQAYKKTDIKSDTIKAIHSEPRRKP